MVKKVILKKSLVGNQAADFGALTLANAGGYQVVASGTISSASITGGTLNDGHCLISSGGVITKNTSTWSSGTLVVLINGTASVTVTITALASTYSVLGDTELTAAITAATAGQTVALRKEGTYAERTLSKSLTLRGHVLRSGYPPDSLAACAALSMTRVDSITVDASNVTLDSLVIQRGTWPSAFDGVVMLSGGVSGTVVQNCLIRHGRLSTHDAYDPNTVYAEYNAASPNNVDRILANGIRFLADISGITLQDNTICDVNWAIQIGFQASAGAMVIQRNNMLRVYGDYMHISHAGGQPSSMYIGWNICSIPLSVAADANQTHPDVIQIDSDSSTGAVNNLTIEGNIYFVGNGRGGLGENQGISIYSHPAVNTYNGVVVRGNILLNVIDTPFSLENHINAKVFGNTFVRQNPQNPPNTFAGDLAVGTTVSGYCRVGGNITESHSLPGGVDNGGDANTLLGFNGATIPYATVFAGPTFDPQTVAEVLAKYTPIGSYATGVHGAVGNGYVDFSARVIDATKEPW